MKLVKNSCFGGYSLSPLATKMIAERKGKECYFFSLGREKKPLTLEEVEASGVFWTAYTVPNPYELSIDKPDEDGLYKTANAIAETISLDFDDRTDPDLVAVVEELGEKANGRCAELEVVEIPDDIEYEIDDYDGLETIREKHRTW